MVADSDPSHECNIPIPYVRKLVLRNNGTMENSRTLPDGIVHFRNFDTQAPQMGPSFLGVEKERPAIAQPHQGIEHGASS